jgi:hypothetical protein
MFLADLRRMICCRRCPDCTKTGMRTATMAWRRTKAEGVGAVDIIMGTQQPAINRSVEGGWAAACKTSTTRRIASLPLLLPLPGMHIQSIGRGEEEEASKWKTVVGGLPHHVPAITGHNNQHDEDAGREGSVRRGGNKG